MDNKDTKKILADNIRLLRAVRRYSQEAVAEIVGVGQNQISELENEHANPSLDTLIRIADAFGVGVSDLFIKKID